MTTLIVWAVIIAILAGTLWMARKAGADSADKKTAQNDVKAAERIADARATGPVNLADVRERLQRGGKL